MKRSQLTAFGKVSEVLRVEEAAVPTPGEGELLLAMLAAPINPADLNIIEGKYGVLPELPAVIGNEGVGRVTQCGAGVTGFAPGDLVLPMRWGTWAEFMTASAEEAIKLPSDLDPLQAAMLSVNPLSAWGMLEEFVDLQKGDWIVQNAANSAVGRSVIQIAKVCGWKSLNVVRRPELVEELKALGADEVVLEDLDLRHEIENLCGSDRPRLGLNAVGGASALNLANALGDGGTLVTYGAMSRQPLKLPNGLLIFRNLVFQGFWLKKWTQQLSAVQRQEIMAGLAELVRTGRLQMPVQRVFALAELEAAIAEANEDNRSGKVLLNLNGAV